MASWFSRVSQAIQAEWGLQFVHVKEYPYSSAKRANSSSFALCGMRPPCADAVDVALVWQKWTQACKLRPQNQGTKGQGKEGGSSCPVMICLLRRKKKTTHLRNLYPHTQIFISSLHADALASTQVKENVIEAHIEGSMADVFLKYNPEWGRGHTAQVVRRE